MRIDPPGWSGVGLVRPRDVIAIALSLGLGGMGWRHWPVVAVIEDADQKARVLSF